jgi:hypothetical protein
LVYGLVLQWNVPYGPYYARYLVSEALPYLMLFVVCVWASWKPGYARQTLTAVLAVSMVYAAALSSGQLGKQENAGLYDALSELVAPVGQSDVILLESPGSGLSISELKTPLVFTFGKQVVNVTSADLSDPAYVQTIDQKFDDMYLISPRAEAPPGFVKIDSVRVKVEAFSHGQGPPLQLVTRGNARLHLVRQVSLQLPMGEARSFQSGSDWIDWLGAGWSTPESWGVWAVGHEASLSIGTKELPESATGLKLHFVARLYMTPSHPRQRVQVDMEGDAVQTLIASYPNTQLSFDLRVTPELLQSGRQLQVRFKFPDAVSPQSLGLSRDPRQLSMGLVSVKADPLPAQ